MGEGCRGAVGITNGYNHGYNLQQLGYKPKIVGYYEYQYQPGGELELNPKVVNRIIMAMNLLLRICIM